MIFSLMTLSKECFQSLLMIQTLSRCRSFLPRHLALLTWVLMLFSVSCFSEIINDTTKRQPPQHDPDSSKKNIPPLQSRFSEYEPNYIISNFGQSYFGQVKFKISFKFDLKIKSEINKFYFGFTQIAFWDLYEQSAPMREFDLTPTL